MSPRGSGTPACRAQRPRRRHRSARYAVSSDGLRITGLSSTRSRTRLGRRARVLRWVAAGFLFLAVGAVAGWALSLTIGGAELSTARWLGLPASVCCPGLVAVVSYAAARVSRREATEQLWLTGHTLVVVDDLDGRTEYDLTALPVVLVLRSLMARATARAGRQPAGRPRRPLVGNWLGAADRGGDSVAA